MQGQKQSQASKTLCRFTLQYPVSDLPGVVGRKVEEVAYQFLSPW